MLVFFNVFHFHTVFKIFDLECSYHLGTNANLKMYFFDLCADLKGSCEVRSHVKSYGNLNESQMQ